MIQDESDTQKPRWHFEHHRVRKTSRTFLRFRQLLIGARPVTAGALTRRAYLPPSARCRAEDATIFTGIWMVSSGVSSPTRAAPMLMARPCPLPGQGRFSRYEERGGMRIPTAGEVEWLLPEGPEVYWRGEITNIDFEYG